jgi:hypothetical protein
MTNSGTSNLTEAQSNRQKYRDPISGLYSFTPKNEPTLDPSITDTILNRGSLVELGRAAENLADQIENYDREEARLNLTGHKKEVAFRSYLDAAADHDRNSLRAIGDWAGTNYPEANSLSEGPDGNLWIRTSEGEDIRVPEHLAKGLSDSYRDLLPSDESTQLEVLRNIEWITDDNLIDVDLGDTLDLDNMTDDVFAAVSLIRDVDGSLTLTYESRLNLAGILAQHGHELDGMTADEYAYEHQNVLTKTISDRYGLMISNAGEDHATIGGYVTDENWTEATVEQISGLLYSSELVRFYNESDNGTNGSDNLSRVLVEAVKRSRETKAA